MLTVGLTGGLACGKSFISEELKRLGCHVIQADRLGHEVLTRDGECYEDVVRRFGPAILDRDGNIDRPQLAGIVFNDPAELKALNAIVHPAVQRHEERMIAEIAAKEPDAVIVIEAAILIEAGLHRRFNLLIVATCDEASQLERALARNPDVSALDIRARMERQMPMDQKRAAANFVIDTSGEPEATLRQTRHIYSILRDMAIQRRAASCQNGRTE